MLVPDGGRGLRHDRGEISCLILVKRRVGARGAATLVAVVALVVSACGGDDEDSNADTTAAGGATETTAGATEATAASGTETAADGTESTAADSETTAGSEGTAAAPAGSEITIGFAIGETGGSSSTQRYARPVAEAWAEWVNTEIGGINGHPVNLVVRDTKSDGATGAAVVRELVEQDNAVVLLSVDASSRGGLWRSTRRQQDVPVIGAGYSRTTWIALPNWFATSTTAPAVVQEQFVAAKEVGATKWAAIACTEVASCAAAEPLYAPSAAQVGLEVGGSIEASTSAPNYTAECLQLISEGVDFIQLNIAPAAGQKIVGDCQRQGYTGWFGASAGAVVGSTFADPALRLAGGLNGFPWFADAEPVQAFRDVMESAGVEEYQDPTLHGDVWAPLELFRTAMADASDEPDPRRGVPGLLRPRGRGRRRPAPAGRHVHRGSTVATGQLLLGLHAGGRRALSPVEPARRVRQQRHQRAAEDGVRRTAGLTRTFCGRSGVTPGIGSSREPGNKPEGATCPSCWPAYG